MILKFKVEAAGAILDFLATVEPSVDWQSQLKSGKVRVNNSFVGVKYQVGAGQVVTYDPYCQIAEPKVNKAYNIIYQDDSLVVVDKPTPLPIHPTGTYFRNTLVETLKSEAKDWTPLHRIDSETSGLLFLTPDKKWVAKWSGALKAAQKVYLVLVDGKTPKSFKVDMPLGRRLLPAEVENDAEQLSQWVHKKRGRNKEGKAALTYFYRVQEYENRTLLFAFPKTGRTHQIRAHLCESGYSVVGDKIYGKDERYFIEFLRKGLSDSLLKKLELPRQFLHAYKTTLIHPFTGKRLILKAPLPRDLTSFLKGLNLKEP